MELIHIDIRGPFTPTTLSGYRYFITLSDDLFHYGHVEFIHEKSDSLVTFKKFKVKTELQNNKRLKAVKSDISGEFYGRYDEIGRNPRSFAIYLRECGIDAQYTMSGTP